MGLINELQESSEKDDAIVVLKKAKRLSSKLGLKDISDWIEHELNGYPVNVSVPFYRKIMGQLFFQTNGYIPVGYGMVGNGLLPANIPNLITIDNVLCSEPLNTICNFLKDNEKSYCRILEEDQQLTLKEIYGNNEFINGATFVIKLDRGGLLNIPEQVKNKILDWACKLEESGIKDDDKTFSEEDKNKASKISIINMFNNIDKGGVINEFKSV
jgi:hypothetical protein